MIGSPPTPARFVKQILLFFFLLFILYYVKLITIIWQNLGDREGRVFAPPPPPRMEEFLGGPPRVALPYIRV